MSPPIDLRSDTVTRPTPAMREAMASAPVGDDQFGEDPTINALQERVAALLGKEAALWLPTGTMANQVALRVLTRPGDHVVVSRESHAVWHETGGAGANAGVQLTEIGSARRVHRRGVSGRRAIRADTCSFRRRRSWRWRTRTTDRAESCFRRTRRGGSARPRVSMAWQATWMGRGCGTPRLRVSATPSDLAAPFDLVSVAFSKGLGAPGGSMLAGSRAIIDAPLRHRRMLGGAMRQVGVFAAAALHALDHHMARLAEDHENAALIARRLVRQPACHTGRLRRPDEHHRVQRHR